MWGQLTAAGITLAVIALLVWALMRASARGGQMEADADHQLRQNKANVADQERADEIERNSKSALQAVKKDAERVAGDGDALSKRLQRTGRGRAPKD